MGWDLGHAAGHDWVCDVVMEYQHEVSIWSINTEFGLRACVRACHCIHTEYGVEE